MNKNIDMKANNAAMPTNKGDAKDHPLLHTGIIKLLISQLQSAICDNNHAMEKLTENFVAIANDIQIRSADTSSTAEECAPLKNSLDEMLTAFQEHDAFNQRIEHISDILVSIDSHLDDESLRNDIAAWEQLCERLAASYTTTQERMIHAAATSASGEATTIRACANDDPNAGSIELF